MPESCKANRAQHPPAQHVPAEKQQQTQEENQEQLRVKAWKERGSGLGHTDEDALPSAGAFSFPRKEQPRWPSEHELARPRPRWPLEGPGSPRCGADVRRKRTTQYVVPASSSSTFRQVLFL